jgi:hypothetical protein
MPSRRIDAKKRRLRLIRSTYPRQYDLAHDLLNLRTVDCILPVKVYGNR